MGSRYVIRLTQPEWQSGLGVGGGNARRSGFQGLIGVLRDSNQRRPKMTGYNTELAQWCLTLGAYYGIEPTCVGNFLLGLLGL